MAKAGKRIKGAMEQIDRNRNYQVEDAIKVVKACASAKFDETIEISMNLDIDPEEATKAGADIVGAEDLAEKIQAGEMNFDRCIATPDMMAIVGRLGKVLGPRGLMPNPKLGTVTPDVATAIKGAKGGEVTFRAEKAGIVHAGIGKASFSEEDLTANVRAFVDAITRARPSGAKGTYIKKVSLASTMSPGLKLDLNSATGNA